jgi:hypothetical protein
MRDASDATATVVNRRLRPTFRCASLMSGIILDMYLTMQEYLIGLHNIQALAA